jgi:hypothetical protein
MDQKKKTGLSTMIDFIVSNIDRLPYEERRDVLQIVINNGIQQSALKEKGTGTSVRFSDMSEDTIRNLYAFISEKKTNMQNELKNFPDST